MHITLAEVLVTFVTFYTSFHALCSVVAPLLPPPQPLGNRWYPAIYAAIQWVALGNGPKPPQKVEPNGNTPR